MALSPFVARVGVLGIAAALGVLLPAGPAGAKGGEVGGTGNEYFLNDAWTSTANIRFFYGGASDQVYVGDWNDDRVDSLAVRNGNLYHFRNSLSSGPADSSVPYGRATDTVLVGDWDGDGDDTLAVRRENVYFFKNDLSGGAADVTVTYGRATDAVLVGDWDGDGVDTLAVRRGNVYFFKDDLSGGAADVTQTYGRTTDSVVVGDWDGEYGDSLAVRRENVYYIKNGFEGGPADLVLTFGRAGDAVLAGDWNGDGTDTLGLRRVGTPVSFGPGTQDVGEDIAAGTYRSTSTTDLCYWERLSGFSGADADVITFGFGPRQIVTVAASDAGFSSEDECLTWVAVDATYPTTLPGTFVDGMYVVGGHIAPGTYRSNSTGPCYWERLRGFSGTEADVIDNNLVGAPTVTIAATDRGFLSDGCGTWTRL